MSVSKQIKLIYNAYFSQPSSDRLIYQAIRRIKARRIIECGIGTTQRAMRIIETAKLVSPNDEIHFAGIDLFEARSSADGPGVSLKMAHRRLTATGAKIKLIPGDPLSALARTANSLGKTDLLVISARQNPIAMSAAWFFVPRILHDSSVVLEEQPLGDGRMSLVSVSVEELARRAGDNRRNRVA